ncbi:MAG: hypothetical protein MN733_14135, partial [Nitrososphaera sp.]|nr:hypothetical protein [Nitrososphaera sp.]
LTRKDTVIVMGRGRGQSHQLHKRLHKEGFSSVYAEFARKGFVELLLHSTFFIQLLVLRIARVRKVNEPYFLRNRRLLKLSSDFIYG